MSVTPAPEVPAASDATAAPGEESPASLATAVADLVRAFAKLLNLELTLARRSLRWLLIGAIAIPVIGLSTWLSLSALLVALVHMYTSSWLLALLSGTGVQCLALAVLLLKLRRWARDLTLPQSRAALAQAMERIS